MTWPPLPDVAPDPADLEKLETFRAEATKGARSPRVVDLASSIAKAFRPDDWWSIAKEIHRFVRDGIRYQRDPDVQQLPAGDYAPDVTLASAWGNCVAKTVLAAAMYRALGMQAEVWPVFTGPIMTHVLTRVKFPGSQRLPVAKDDGWIYGEFTIRGTELGDDPRGQPRDADTGSLPLSGGPEGNRAAPPSRSTSR